MSGFKAGEGVICVERSKTARLTVGKEYIVERVRDDIDFPTVVNDLGRKTQYSGRWFVRSKERSA